MPYQKIFKRYELKYLLTAEQRERVLQAIAPYMAADAYGRTTIRNLYLDTPSYRLIRRSLEKPDYKEKLRIRSYAQVGERDTVFVELKKKYRHVVYKRRIPLAYAEAMTWIAGGEMPDTAQITQEIAYALSYYAPLRPTVFLSYEREAFYERGGGDFRITFDDHIVYRTTDLSLFAPADGTALLPPDRVLMELKCSGGIPLWMTAILSREKLYKTSFSKYGTAYQMMMKEKAYAMV